MTHGCQTAPGLKQPAEWKILKKRCFNDCVRHLKQLRQTNLSGATVESKKPPKHVFRSEEKEGQRNILERCNKRDLERVKLLHSNKLSAQTHAIITKRSSKRRGGGIKKKVEIDPLKYSQQKLVSPPLCCFCFPLPAPVSLLLREKEKVRVKWLLCDVYSGRIGVGGVTNYAVRDTSSLD